MVMMQTGKCTDEKSVHIAYSQGFHQDFKENAGLVLIISKIQDWVCNVWKANVNSVSAHTRAICRFQDEHVIHY